ncbi:MAG: hypothetical protein QM784_27410 [Polyangiaceae bacterium]
MAFGVFGATNGAVRSALRLRCGRSEHEARLATGAYRDGTAVVIPMGASVDSAVGDGATSDVEPCSRQRRTYAAALCLPPRDG